MVLLDELRVTMSDYQKDMDELYEVLGVAAATERYNVLQEEIAKEGSAFVGTGAQSPINIGKDAAKTVMAVLEDKDYEEEIQEETFIINKDNVELYGTNGWQ